MDGTAIGTIWQRSLEDPVDEIAGPPVLLGDGVGVGVQRDADVGVAEALLHDLVVADDHPADGLGGVAQALGREAGLSRPRTTCSAAWRVRCSSRTSTARSLMARMRSLDSVLRSFMTGRPRTTARCWATSTVPSSLHGLFERHRKDLAYEAGRRGAESGLLPFRRAVQVDDPVVEDLGCQVPQPNRADERDDVALDRPPVLVERRLLDPSLLRAQPHADDEGLDGLVG